jgi:hypothetical protein
MRFSEVLVAAATLGSVAAQRALATGATTGGVQTRKNLNDLCSMNGPERYVDLVVGWDCMSSCGRYGTSLRGSAGNNVRRDGLLTTVRQDAVLPCSPENAGRGHE